MNGHVREDRALEAWCTVVSRIERAAIRTLQRPDRDAPGQGGCDAILDKGGHRYALEHTSLDSYQSRRQDDDRYRKVVLPVAGTIEATFQDSWVEIEVPVHAIPTGQDWATIRQAMTARFVEAVRSLPIADYYDLTRTRFDWADVPFPVWISRRPLGGGEHARCLIFRQAPVDLHDQLAQDIRRALDDKTTQLRPYKQAGESTVLLLDFDDIVLLNRDMVADAFARAIHGWNGTDTIDQVFLIDSGRRPPWVYPVKLGHSMYPELPEFRDYFSAQFRSSYGDDAAQ